MIATAVFALAAVLSAAAPNAVTGEVSFRERMALPPGAVLVVSLDRLGKDSLHENLSEVSLRLEGQQPPIAYSLPYLARSIKSGEQYGVRAAILVEGRRWFESPRATMVIANGKRTANLVLTRARQDGPKLDGAWELVALEGQKVTLEGRRPSLVFDSERKQAGGYTGVNTFGGSFTWSPPHVQIDPGPMTKMAGPPERMELENDYIRVLPMVNRLTIEEGMLILWRGEREMARFRRSQETGR